jgi:hypothetical protein
MATPTIPNGETQFFPILYEGTGGGQRVGKFVPFTDSGTIANSCIFNDADNAYLSRTNDAGDRDTFTISVWVKRCTLGAVQHIFDTYDGSSSNDGYIRFNADNTISLRLGSPSNMLYTTNQTFEGTSKWYHIMLSVNTNDSTAGDRAKLYVDGDRITSFSTQTNAGSGDNTQFNYSSATFSIGSTTNGSYDLDGYLAEFNQVDGQALLPASFGETDTSTGRWVPSTVKPYPTTTTSIAVTVVSSGGNKYALDGVTQGTVTLIEGATYKFDQSDSSNSGHPLRFSTTSDGTHNSGTEFTSGVTTAGTPGSSGAYTEITVPTGTATLYYYCSSHSGMGGQANTQNQYGDNGFRLKFQDSSSLGDDTSGNTNDFTATNLASTDQTTDSPTQNFNTFGSFASGTSASEGNLTISTGTTNGDTQCVGQAGFGVATGKWYWEAKITTVGAGLYGWKDDANAGGSQAVNTSSNGTHSTNNSAGMLSTGSSGSFSSGSWFIDGGYGDEVNYTTVSTNDVLMFAIDLDTGKGYCGKNGTWFNSANPANGTGEIGGCHFSNGINKFYPMARRLDSNSVAEYNFGQRSFAHTPPTGFSALQQDNMPETAKGIAGLTWIKDRDATKNHNLFDSNRGKQKELRSNSTDEEFTNADTLQKFLKGGFSIEDGTSVNNSGDSFVSWNWVANGGTTSSNSDGNVTCTLQVNDTAKFSIQTWTNTGAGTKTIGHGLGVKPGFIIQKRLDTTSNWFTYHHSLSGNGDYLHLNNTDAQQNGSDFANTEPTSSVFSSNASGSDSATFVSYCFAEVDGFSKFGKYTGNGNADGTYVYTGFRPAWIMVKEIGTSSYDWQIWDTKRSPINPSTNQALFPNGTTAEGGTSTLDILSNGWKWRSNAAWLNNSGNTYIYMAFAEHPFVGDGTNPVTAR